MTTNQTSNESDAIEPFHINIPQSELDDLKHRLEWVRWPDRETVDDWKQGVPLDKAKSLVDYWRLYYDWRRFESRANKYPHFRTMIDGVGIHFIHVKSQYANALPIILTHGWPGSFIEFLRVIPRLTDPVAFGGKAEDAFHVVVPSLPGYGFSDKPKETEWNSIHIARAWVLLMQRLGYKRWVAQGGDWGADVATVLGSIHPVGLLGIHLNFQFVFPEKQPDNPTPDEQRAIDGANYYLSDGWGFFQEQGTRPQTIGYGLCDSPVALAMWIYEKFYEWTDNNGEPEDAVKVDDILDNITLYWLTNTGASAARLFWERRLLGVSLSGPQLTLPVAASVFPREVFRAPKSWAQQTYSNLIYWNELEKGGHFAAFEQPELFAQELYAAFRTLRNV
ncbi:unnamed protein product [Adineta ricciae]|uniref:Epoxide hydrolase n=1 Tax=Adineta ricciae TaxID=249248 RepID=A0A815JXY2_ADIRI|nr:unnamed protein product [Adineta ricciae]CAF1650501.1 unnamed protein product [Adineta ricciae]